jgi:hypothetical protein
MCTKPSYAHIVLSVYQRPVVSDPRTPVHSCTELRDLWAAAFSFPFRCAALSLPPEPSRNSKSPHQPLRTCFPDSHNRRPRPRPDRWTRPPPPPTRITRSAMTTASSTSAIVASAPTPRPPPPSSRAPTPRPFAAAAATRSFASAAGASASSSAGRPSRGSSSPRSQLPGLLLPHRPTSPPPPTHQPRRPSLTIFSPR